jgi:DNA-binding MarR family transcriptional regulator
MKKTTQETTYDLLQQVTELWQAEIKLELNEYNLTATEFTMLSSIAYLTQNNTEVTQTEVCNYAQIKPMNASILLRKLNVRKFVQRKEHSIDTRAKTITLTTLGEETVLKISTEISEISNRFFGIPKNRLAEFTKHLQEIRDRKI